MTALEHELASNIAEPQVSSDVAWVSVCPVERVRLDRGIAALVAGRPVAIFRLSPVGDEAEDWCAVSHIDPETDAPVMARGLVGSTGTPPLVIPTVASPIYKERYNLRTGVCLDRADLRLETFPIRLHNGFVEVGAHVIST